MQELPLPQRRKRPFRTVPVYKNTLAIDKNGAGAHTDVSAGLHHDLVPASLLEGRAPGIPVAQQPEQDVRLAAGQEDLGPRCLLCALQAFLYPRYHHGEHHATRVPRREHPLQRQVGRQDALGKKKP